MKSNIIIFFICSMFVFSMAQGKEAIPMAEDPVVEARMLDLAKNLRCLVCQNQSLAGSDSDFANDLRREMRDMIGRGMSDQEIIEFMVERFGDFILYNPPVKLTTMLLWFGPILLLSIGAFTLIRVLKLRRKMSDVPLSEDDHRRAKALLKNEKDGESAV